MTLPWAFALVLIAGVSLLAGRRAWVAARCARAGHRWETTAEGVRCRRCGRALADGDRL